MSHNFRYVTFIVLLLKPLLVFANEPFCANRTVYVVADKSHAEDIKAQFMMISSLPFEIRTVPLPQHQAEIQISYRRLTPADTFSEPQSLELGQRVYEVLKDTMKKFEIHKIRATFDPDLKC